MGFRKVKNCFVLLERMDGELINEYLQGRSLKTNHTIPSFENSKNMSKDVWDDFRKPHQKRKAKPLYYTDDEDDLVNNHKENLKILSRNNVNENYTDILKNETFNAETQKNKKKLLSSNCFDTIPKTKESFQYKKEALSRMNTNYKQEWDLGSDDEDDRNTVIFDKYISKNLVKNRKNQKFVKYKRKTFFQAKKFKSNSSFQVKNCFVLLERMDSELINQYLQGRAMKTVTTSVENPINLGEDVCNDFKISHQELKGVKKERPSYTDDENDSIVRHHKEILSRNNVAENYTDIPTNHSEKSYCSIKNETDTTSFEKNNSLKREPSWFDSDIPKKYENSPKYTFSAEEQLKQKEEKLLNNICYDTITDGSSTVNNIEAANKIITNYKKEDEWEIMFRNNVAKNYDIVTLHSEKSYNSLKSETNITNFEKNSSIKREPFDSDIANKYEKSAETQSTDKQKLLSNTTNACLNTVKDDFSLVSSFQQEKEIITNYMKEEDDWEISSRNTVIENYKDISTETTNFNKKYNSKENFTFTAETQSTDKQKVLNNTTNACLNTVEGTKDDFSSVSNFQQITEMITNDKEEEEDWDIRSDDEDDRNTVIFEKNFSKDEKKLNRKLNTNRKTSKYKRKTFFQDKKRKGNCKKINSETTDEMSLEDTIDKQNSFLPEVNFEEGSFLRDYLNKTKTKTLQKTGESQLIQSIKDCQKNKHDSRNQAPPIILPKNYNVTYNGAAVWSPEIYGFPPSQFYFHNQPSDLVYSHLLPGGFAMSNAYTQSFGFSNNFGVYNHQQNTIYNYASSDTYNKNCISYQLPAVPVGNISAPKVNFF